MIFRTLYRLALLLLPIGALAQTSFPAQNAYLLGRWQSADPHDLYSGVVSYAAQGREYAIVGTRGGTAFVEITDPAHPRLVRFVEGRRPADEGGRSYQVYQHYAYGIAEGQGGHSLQVFDLRELPNSVRLVLDSPALSQGAAGCFVSNGNLYLAGNLAGNDSATYKDFDRLSLTFPELPQQVERLTFAHAGNLSISRARSITADADTVYVGLSTSAALQIFTYRGQSRVNFIGPWLGANISQVAVDPAGKWLLGLIPAAGDSAFAIFLLQHGPLHTQKRPVLKGVFGRNSLAQPQRASFRDSRFLAVAYGYDGLRFFDLADPVHAQQVGYFDTWPAHDTVGYGTTVGCRDVDVALPSGMVLATDRTGGLFIIAPPYGGTPNAPQPAPLGLWPNPTTSEVNLGLPYAAQALSVEILDALGRRVAPVQSWQRPQPVVQLSAAGLQPGTYWLRLLRPDEPPRLERLVVE